MAKVAVFAGYLLTLVAGSASITDDASALAEIRSLFTSQGKPLSVDPSEVELWKFIPDLLEFVRATQLPFENSDFVQTLAQRDETIATLQTQTQDLDSVRAELAEAKNFLETANEQLKLLREQRVEETSRLELLVDSENRLQTLIAKSQSDLADAAVRFEELRTSSAEQIGTLEAEKRRVTEEAATQVAESHRLQSELATVQDRLRTKSDEAESRICSATEDMNRLRTEHSAIISGMQQQLDRVNQEKTAQADELVRLQNAAGLSSHLAQSQLAAARLDLTGSKKLVATLIADAQRVRNEANAAAVDTTRLNAEVGRLTEEATTTASNQAALMTQLADRTRQKEELQQQLDRVNQEKTAQADELVRLQNAAGLSSHLAQIRLAAARLDLTGSKKLVATLTADLQRVRNEANAAAEDTTRLNAEIRRLTEEATTTAEELRQRVSARERELVNVREMHQIHLDKNLALENEKILLTLAKDKLTKEKDDLINASSGNPTTNASGNKSTDSGMKMLKGGIIGAGSVFGLVAISLAIYKFRFADKTTSSSTATHAQV